MHGVRKVKTDEEEKRKKAEERAKKLAKFTAGRDVVLSKHSQKIYDDEGLSVSEKLLLGNPDVSTFWNYRRCVFLHYEQQQQQQQQCGKAESTSTSCVVTIDGSGDAPMQESKMESTKDAQAHQGSSTAAKEITTAQLQSLYETELRLTFACLETNPKSYGWYVGVLRGLIGLKKVCKLAKISPKQELEFGNKKINDNFSNYSAWHYRSSLLPLIHPDRSEGERLQLDRDVLKDELKLAMNAFYTDPEDQAAWFYTAWLCQEKQVSNLDASSILAVRIKAETPHNCVLFLFNQPIDVKQLESVMSSVLLIPLKASDWSAVNGRAAGAGDVWSIPMDTILNNELIVLDMDGGAQVHLSPNRRPLWIRKSALINHVGGSQPPEDIIEALTIQSKACMELVEEEKDNLWPRLVATFCMKRLNNFDREYSPQIISNLKALQETDPKRRHYYQDLISQELIVGRLLESLQALNPDRPCDTAVLDLNGLNLRSLTFPGLISVCFHAVDVAENDELTAVVADPNGTFGPELALVNLRTRPNV